MYRAHTFVVQFWHGFDGWDSDRRIEANAKAFTDEGVASAYLARCRRRLEYGGWGLCGVSEKAIWLPVAARTAWPRVMWCVRVARYEDLLDALIPSDDPHGLEGVFATREEAEAFQAERERQAGLAGHLGPLLAFRYLERMVELSDFELTVFGDWLTDHGITTLPDPDKYVEGWGRWVRSLTREHVNALYAALHRFRFYEVVEAPLVVGEYPEDQWEAWEMEEPSGPPPGGQDDIPF